MPKIDNTSIKRIKNCESLRVFKYVNSKNYYVSFYVSKDFSSNFMYEKSLKVKDYKVAIKLAKDIYRTFDKESFQKKNSAISFDKDIAQPFFKSRLKKYTAKNKPEYAIKEQNRYENYIKPIFLNVDYRNADYLENAIDDLVLELREKKLKDTTISKYINLLSLMFQKSFKSRKIDVLPEFPPMKRINEERPMYYPKEIKRIVNAFIDEYKRTEDTFYDEVADYINFCRSSPVRPTEPLKIRRFQIKFLNDTDNPTEPILSFNLYKTKTKDRHIITVHPEFQRLIYNERMMKRYPNATAEDYLFFPKEKNRDKLYERIRKNFTRISRELKLYYFNNKERPMYSIRHTFITNRVNKDIPMQIVADTSNTSSEVIKTNYLEYDDTTILNRHKKLFADFYTKSKVKKLKVQS